VEICDNFIRTFLTRKSGDCEFSLVACADVSPPLPDLLQIAIEAARLPSELILSGFRSKQLGVERKGDGSPVTAFDREAEKRVRAFLAKHTEWPVLGEEFGGEGSEGSKYRWVIDPIDGTLPFSRGLPTFGTLLAFEEVATSRALVGVIHLPALHETYSAALGSGAWCDGERLQVAPERELKDCIVSAPAEYHFRLADIAESHEKLRAQAPHLRCFADCWAHAMVARGAVDALAEFNLGRWDIAATEIIVTEAGGRAIVRKAPYSPGKYDGVVGSPRAATEVASLLRIQTG
jgi:histidinol-phosphatase